jgi:hypothetical protein
MSQSGSAYEDKSPKDSARTRRHRPDISGDTTDGESDSAPEPACRSRHVEDWNWREIPYSDRVLASYRLCEWPECFGDGPPDATTETVIRSRRAPTVIHRPHESDTHSHEATDESYSCGHNEHTDTRAFEAEVNPADYQPVTAVAELRLGDGVIWEALETPKEVIKRNDESSAVTLEGPAGGEFVLRERYDSGLVAYPGHGCVSVSRIPAGSRPERA